MARSLLLVVVVGFVLGCAGALKRDEDKDGFAADEDCDDTNPAIHPGAVEVCDDGDVDEDCNGVADDDDPAPGGLLYWFVDTDGDGFGVAGTASVQACDPPSGYGAEGDCDDTNGAAWPGADEHCDGVDEDCDGVVDNDPVEGAGFYVDGDGDGYGGAEVVACEASEGVVEASGDCDDADALTHPAAAEICDAQDNDCDGLTDDADPDFQPDTGRPWHRDADGDGYGSSTDVVEACEQPGGYTDNGEDCDDTDGTVHPGAEETCGNGVDDDCDGTPGPCGFSGDVPLSTADATSAEGADGSLRDAHLFAAKDWSLDGGAELVLVSPDVKEQTAWAWAGGPRGSFGLGDATTVIHADVDHARAGGAADLDGDLAADLLLAGEGELAIFDGAPGADVDFSEADRTINIEASAVLGLPDHDGDTRDELVAFVLPAALVYEGPLPTSSSAANSRAYYYDSTDGLDGILCAAGDVYGDGVEDLFLGDAVDGRGEAWVVDGPFAVGTQDVRDVAAHLAADSSVSYFGTRCAAGDANGDGYGDVFIGADGLRVLGFFGPLAASTSSADADFTVDGGESFAAGDVDGDGQADLVVGAEGEGRLYPGVDLTGALGAGDAHATFGFTAGLYPHPLVDDLDGDGTDDVVLFGPSGRPADLAIWYAEGI